MTQTHDQRMLQNANELLKVVEDANAMLKAENIELRERCAYWEHQHSNDECANRMLLAEIERLRLTQS